MIVKRETQSYPLGRGEQVSNLPADAGSSIYQRSDQSDSLQSCAQVEQYGEEGCLQTACSCFAQVICSFFKMIFSYSRKEESHQTENPSSSTSSEEAQYSNWSYSEEDSGPRA